MSTEPGESASPAPSRASLFNNWLSYGGLVLALGSLFSFLLLFVLDSFAHVSNPYIGILTYFVSPAFLVFGLGTAVVGAWWQHRRVGRQSGVVPKLQIDFSRPRDRKYFALFLLGALGFLLLSALGSYHTYHFTESTAFCGETCHKVMSPELITYHNSPHARVPCTQCHIGPGATWFVRSKLSGTYQVYATLANKYPRPVPTPVKNLRPAQETCEQCHWPKQFVGNLDRSYTYFLNEKTNTFHSIRMLLKVGGADATHGPVGGIHWHMNVGNKIEYIATDEARQKIGWVRMTDPKGVVTEFRTPKFTNQVNAADIRSMDCIDCHNRPAHRYDSPNNAVNLAMSLGRIDPTVPWIKSNAVYAVTQPYPTRDQGKQSIAAFLSKSYPGEPRIAAITEVVQEIYTNNFFPEMKANWRAYPNNIGHKDWPGCFRCHDSKHKTADGKQSIKGSECNVCHVILSQGSGSQLDQLNGKGQEFKHPGDEIDKDARCDECHTGGL